jgi:tetratricopeptide (TPR) repeat protein
VRYSASPNEPLGVVHLSEEASAPPDIRQAAEELRGGALPLLAAGAYRHALALYDQALALAVETGDAVFVDWMFVCRAAAAVEIGGGGDVLVELERVVLRSSGSPQTSFRASYTAARGHEIERRFGKALFYNRIARRQARRAGDATLAAFAERQRGMLLVAAGSFHAAVRCFQDVLAARPQAELLGLPSSSFLADAKDELGYCLISLDRVRDGLALVHEALDIVQAGPPDSGDSPVWILMDLCFGYLKLGRFAEARYFGELGLERSTPDTPVERCLLYLIGEACHLGGERAASSDYFDRLAARYPGFANLRAYLAVLDFRNVLNLRS